LFKKEICTGSFFSACFIATWAVCILHPFNSNIICPGRTACTQYLIAPFPLPILVSFGFFVIARFGASRHHIFACFFNLRRKSILTDSLVVTLGVGELQDFPKEPRL